MITSDIYYMIELALLFVLIVTGAWKKSISTTLFVAVLVYALYDVEPCSLSIKHIIINLVSFFAVIRAILQKTNDMFLRKCNACWRYYIVD